MNPCQGCDSYQRMTRRQWLRSAVGAAGGATFLGLLDPRILYAAPKKKPDRAQSVILLWMGGGMSHLDTFDPQPGSEFGGPFEGIKTTADGLVISQHLPRIASQFKHLSLIRSMTSNEFDHDRATYLMHTGYQVLPSMKHSTLGSITAKYLGPSPRDANLPPYVSIGIDWAAGYLGPKFAPYYVGAAERANENLVVPEGVGERRFNDRLKLLSEFDRSFRAKYPRHPVLEGFAEHYNAALLMMRPRTAKVFDLDAEPDAIRAAYGETSGFGQGCLLARRLVQSGVRFIEVALPGWDTHQDNFETVKSKSGELDMAVSTLIEDLRAKDLWDQTVVILTSEFGRTPNINGNQGRDHWPRVWSTIIGGGGLVAGQVIGASDRGHEVADRPIRVGELHATICQALDIDWTRSNKSPDGRPFRVVNDHSAAPIAELFA